MNLIKSRQPFVRLPLSFHPFPCNSNRQPPLGPNHGPLRTQKHFITFGCTAHHRLVVNCSCWKSHDDSSWTNNLWHRCRLNVCTSSGTTKTEIIKNILLAIVYIFSWTSQILLAEISQANLRGKFQKVLIPPLRAIRCIVPEDDLNSRHTGKKRKVN